MKKILFSLALIGTFAAMSAKGDSYIYWMADISDTSQGDNATIAKYGFSYANLIIQDNEGKYVADLGYAPSVDTKGLKTAPRVTSESLESFFANHSTDYSTYSFAVELYNEDFSWKMAKSDAMSWNTLVGYDALYRSTWEGGAGKAAFTSFTYNAPEPTSGLLILLGMCGLALKRKRV